MTASNAPDDGASLSRLAKDLATEVDSIHRLRLGRTNSKPWENELEAQLPADLTSLRDAVSETDGALSKLKCEHHFSKDGLTTSFLAKFDGDHKAAIRALPELIEDAGTAHQLAAAALSDRRLDEAKAENRLIEGWLATHSEQLRAMRDEFAQPYERQLVALARLHNGPVQIDPWRETSHCGVLLKIVDATLKLLDSERSMDNYMESARLSKSFAHLTATEWEDLEMSIRSEAARLGAQPRSADDGPADPPRVDNRFISKGKDTWVVSFQGGAEFILRGKGATYLHHLLLQPGRPLKATLLQSLAANQTEAIVRSNANTGSNGDAMQTHERHFNELEDSKRVAIANGDEAEAASIHLKLATLAERVQNDEAVKLVQRQKRDPDKKARQAVARAIKSALKDITRENPKLARHLEKPTLQLGTSLMYSPIEETRWAL